MGCKFNQTPFNSFILLSLSPASLFISIFIFSCIIIDLSEARKRKLVSKREDIGTIIHHRIKKKAKTTERNISMKLVYE